MNRVGRGASITNFVLVSSSKLSFQSFFVLIAKMVYGENGTQDPERTQDPGP